MPQTILRRLPEITWNFKKPPEPFPQTPGASGVFLAPSGMGKTTTLIAMLPGPYKGIFDQVHVFSPSVDIDGAWLPVKELAGHLMEGSTFNSEWDEPALRTVLGGQRNQIKDLSTPNRRSRSCRSSQSSATLQTARTSCTLPLAF